MKFFYYDMIFLGIFCVILAIFLIKNRKKIDIESKIFLIYRTKIGIKFINWVTKTFPKTINVLSYFSITFGYILMLAAFLLIFLTIYLVAYTPIASKIPPIAPLFPYMPQIFNLPLPNFYFTYWIIAIIIIAATHEFAHGIFAKASKVNIKATGFGFLGPFLAAFVEPNEKMMRKKKPKQQLAILAGGSFSNLVFAIIFLLLLQAYFFGFYEKAGVTNYMYVTQQVNTSAIEKIGNYNAEDFFKLNSSELKKINETLTVTGDNKTFFIDPELLFQISQIKKYDTMLVYSDAPAIRAGLEGPIKQIGEFKVNGIEDVTNALSNYEVNDTIKVITTKKSYDITLAQHPIQPYKAYLGIGFIEPKGALRFLMKIASIASPFFNYNTYVEPRFNVSLILFFQDLLFWLIMISISVAIINMLPLGVLDGGRFLLITALALTKSKKKAARIYKIFTSIILLSLFLLMFLWVIRL